jgi:hypothetical protein
MMEERRDGATMAEERGSASLFEGNEAQDLRSRWETIQAGFVDEPRKSVQDADALVATVIQRLSDVFSKELGPRRRRINRGSADGAAALPLVLRSLAVRVTLAARANPLSPK